MSKVLEILNKRVISYKHGTNLRTPKENDLFERVFYISPQDLLVVNYLRKQPLAAFNPGALLLGRRLLVFPRLVFDYYCYVSSIGVFELNIDSIINNENVIEGPHKVRIILYPTEPWEFLGGCEDPRIYLNGDKMYVLYTGVNSKRNRLIKVHQGVAILDYNFNVLNKNFLKIKIGDELYEPTYWKDSAIVKIRNDSALILTRPEIDGFAVCWKAYVNLNDLTTNIDSLEPILLPERWESRIGWSTNVVKISSNEYLIGWHGVSKNDYTYRNGLAIIDDEGNLLAITDYILSPKKDSIIESYGDRPRVIFGCGLVLYKEFVVWIGGISDYAIGVFKTELDKVMEHMKWVR